jgi:hypothetical protein
MAMVRSNDASKYLEEKYGIRRSPATLNKYASVGGGPLFRKAGRDRIYDLNDLDDYAAEISSGPMRTTSKE